MRINRFLFFSILMIVISGVVIDYMKSERVDDGKGEWDRTWTTALCDGNKCRDYLVSCLGKEVVDMKPITGFVVFEGNWQDKRKNRNLC